MLARIIENTRLLRVRDMIEQIGQSLSSLKITVGALLLLWLLTFFGTLYQVEYGLYAAQQRYFYSWFFMVFKIIPVPGAKTVLLVLTINLISACVYRYRFEPKKYGILIIHYALIFLLVASSMTHYFAKESYIAFNEGESVGVSYNYYDSELTLWREAYDETGRISRDIEAFSAHAIKIGDPIVFSNYNVTLIPEYYHEHARPANFGAPDVASVSGLTALSYMKFPLEREQILPGGLFTVITEFKAATPQDVRTKLQSNQSNAQAQNPRIEYDRSSQTVRTEQKILLWEADPEPYVLETAEGPLYLRLQRKRYPLPFIVTLNDFIKEDYYGTEQAKNFESKVTLHHDNATQESRIYMNTPLRIDNYTFFQASFAQDNQGRERSILAVVYNTGYWVPYVASILLVLGLIVHFIYMFVARHVRKT
ncbi:hypothetical protein COTS27_00606 [Spirochaetota bacterium]|nr:hypothetical protein COTS27_00606 [Spirochaetota bacterium]